MINTIESNKLLAEFMGEIDVKRHDNIFITSYKYDTDWNWLMAVVEKIEDIESIDVDILTHGTRIYEWRSGGRVIADNCADISFDKKIEHAYDSVVKFVKWYNNQK
jgi:hypothetical protein